jgi:hypothetical protein
MTKTHAFFKNIATVRLFGTPPGHVFQLEVDRDGVPVETHWRKRLADGSIEAYSAPGSASPSPPKAPAKKGA